MNIKVNGEARQCPEGMTLLELVNELHLDSQKVVAEHNRVIIKAAELTLITMQDNDEVELLQFVGGG